MRVYQQPDCPTDAEDGDIWVQTQKPTRRERRLVRKGKLPYWLFELPPMDVEAYDALTDPNAESA